MYNWLLKLFGEAPTIEQKSVTLLSSKLRRSRKGMPTTPLLPLPDGLEIISVSCVNDELEKYTSSRIALLVQSVLSHHLVSIVITDDIQLNSPVQDAS